MLVALSVPAMSSAPASSTEVVVLAPFSVQLPPASTASVWKLLNAVPTPTPIEPVPLASSSVFAAVLLAATLPMNTAAGSTISRLVPLPVKSTA